MSTDAAFADHVLEQAQGAGGVAICRIFGEYGLYRTGKTLALVCDDQVFLSTLPEAVTRRGRTAYGPPCLAAKPHLPLSGELDAADPMAQLVRAVADALPVPKPHKPRV
jgi:hypothetical protein